MLRWLAFIQVAQCVGLSLEDISLALASLPEEDASLPEEDPTATDWSSLSTAWRSAVDDRIRILEALVPRQLTLAL